MSDNEDQICIECGLEYTYDSQNKDCDWCCHQRNQQILCPMCSVSIEIFDQTLCAECAYFGIVLESEIWFCENCDEFIACKALDDMAYKPHSKHSVRKDRDFLLTKLRSVYPETGKFLDKIE